MGKPSQRDLERRLEDLEDSDGADERHVDITYISVDENGKPQEVSRRLAGDVMDGGLDEQSLEDVEPEEWVTIVDRTDGDDEPDRYNASLTHAVDFLDMDGVELAPECVDENGEPDPFIVELGEPIDVDAIAAEAEAEERNRAAWVDDRNTGGEIDG